MENDADDKIVFLVGVVNILTNALLRRGTSSTATAMSHIASTLLRMILLCSRWIQLLIPLCTYRYACQLAKMIMLGKLVKMLNLSVLEKVFVP